MSDTQSLETWLADVEVVTRFHATVHAPNPQWRGRVAEVREIITSTKADPLTIEAKSDPARGGQGLTVKETVLEGVADHAAAGNGRYRLTGLKGSARRFYDSTRRLLTGEMRDFARGVDEVNDLIRQGRGVHTGQEPFREYLLTVRADTDSFKQRMTRERLLRDVLDHVFEDLDSCRPFNATQRRIVWHAASSKQCAFCRKPIRRWEEMAVDHVKPHSRGGKTHLSNAAIAHKRCNSKAGAKRRKGSR